MGNWYDLENQENVAPLGRTQNEIRISSLLFPHRVHLKNFPNKIKSTDSKDIAKVFYTNEV
jgi:hypothetical protein